MGRTAEAIEVFQRLIKIDPNSYKGYGNLGVVYTQLSKWAEAIEAFKAAVKTQTGLREGALQSRPGVCERRGQRSRAGSSTKF